MNPLAKRLRASFAAHADRKALLVGAAEFTYAKLLHAADSCAAKLAQVAAPGARVGLLAHRTPGAFAGVLAAVIAGRPYVPINPKAPPHRLQAIAAAAHCAAYLYDEKTEEAATALAAEFSGATLAVDPLEFGERTYSTYDNRHAYVMFTSGTTGTPKGVAVRNDNVVAYLDAFAKIAEVTSDDSCTQMFDLSFDLSVHDMFVTWTNGARLCAPTEEELIDPVGFVNRVGATCWFSVPSIPLMARRMRRLSPNSLSGLRLSLFCGEPLPTSLAAAFCEAAPNSRVWNLYGPTEATIAITVCRFDPTRASEMPATVPLGDAYADCAAVVVGEDGTPAHEGEVGELWLAGAQLTDGYINNADEQRSKFLEVRLPGRSHERWYRSGDLVLQHPEWGLVYQSRLDDQIKISGYRVELLEIEETLRWAAQTPEVAATPWPISESGSAEGVVGFVCGAKVEAREAIARCRARLPPYMVPKRLIALDALPLNANGKLDRKALRLTHLERS